MRTGFAPSAFSSPYLPQPIRTDLSVAPRDVVKCCSSNTFFSTIIPFPREAVMGSSPDASGDVRTPIPPASVLLRKPDDGFDLILSHQGWQMADTLEFDQLGPGA